MDVTCKGRKEALTNKLTLTTKKLIRNPSQISLFPTRSFLETCLETAAKLLRYVKFDQLSHNYNRVKVSSNTLSG